MASAYREYLNAKDFIKEAQDKLKNYDAIMGQTKKLYEQLKTNGIETRAFSGESDDTEKIVVTNKCWKHVFEHDVKRRNPVERLARALSLPSAIKLLKKATTYQEVSIAKGKPGFRPYKEFGVIGYVRGNRIKVVLRQDVKFNKKELVMYSFYQLSSAPREKQRAALIDEENLLSAGSSVR